MSGQFILNDDVELFGGLEHQHLLALQALRIFFILKFFEQQLGRWLNILQHNVPKIGIIDFELIISIVTDESTFREGAGPIYKWVLSYSRIILDNLIYILFKEGFSIITLLPIFQKS